MSSLVTPSGQPFEPFLEFSLEDLEARPSLFSSAWFEDVLAAQKPFVIRGFARHSMWDRSILSAESLTELTPTPVLVRNCATGHDRSMNLRTLMLKAKKSDQVTQLREGMYAKDLRFPESWDRLLHQILPDQMQWRGSLDLFRFLKDEDKPEVLMAYLGTKGSFSGFHRCLSGTVALNLVIDADIDGPTTLCFGTDGSSYSAYNAFIESLGGSPNIDWSKLSVDQLRTATFPIYVTTQQVGDLVVFPAATAHQVINISPVVTKAVWNILHDTSVSIFIDRIQRDYVKMCHPDTARVHLVLWNLVQHIGDRTGTDLPSNAVEFVNLFRDLVTEEESREPASAPARQADVPRGTVIECNFCGLAIWNKHLHCSECANFDLCMYCYSLGRSCKHSGSYVWAEVHSRGHYLEILHQAQSQLKLELTPPSVSDRRSLSEVAQAAWLARSDSKKQLCHLCRDSHATYRSITCSSCSAVFCYRGLYRNFDIDTWTLLRSRGSWTCPKCLQICNCRCCHFSNAKRKERKPLRHRVRALDARGRTYGFMDNVFDHKRGKSTQESGANKRNASPPEEPAARGRRRHTSQGYDSSTETVDRTSSLGFRSTGAAQSAGSSISPSRGQDGQAARMMSSGPSLSSDVREISQSVNISSQTTHQDAINLRANEEDRGMLSALSGRDQDSQSGIVGTSAPESVTHRLIRSHHTQASPSSSEIQSQHEDIPVLESQIAKLESYGASLLEIGLLDSHRMVLDRVAHLQQRVTHEKTMKAQILIREMQKDFPDIADLASLESRQLGLG